MLTTLIKPSSGKAEVCGYDVFKHANEVRRSVGVVPQEYTADEDMTGINNILLCADLYGMPRSDSKIHAEELLELVELQDAAKRKVSTYSGGMRRRLELACGLINYPKLLFLDEPTLGLDVQTRTAVWRYIKTLKEDYHMTLFMTTHYLEEADSVCDRIAIIDHGHIIKTGSPEELKESVGGDVIVVSVKESEPDISSDIAQIKLVTSVRKNDSTYRIKAELGEEASPQITDLIRSKGLHVTKVSLTKPTLDEAYLEFTGRSLREEEVDKLQMFRQRVTMRRARS
jgi:ABC-2 type transport system ATP-binding protein